MKSWTLRQQNPEMRSRWVLHKILFPETTSPSLVLARLDAADKARHFFVTMASWDSVNIGFHPQPRRQIRQQWELWGQRCQRLMPLEAARDP